ncbi:MULTISPECIES: hypothetical protein [Pirellulaceae]|nr:MULTISPECIES: hypothetical protein [Pirellulaceae]
MNSYDGVSSSETIENGLHSVPQKSPSPSWLLMASSLWVIGLFLWQGGLRLGEAAAAVNNYSSVSVGLVAAWCFAVAVNQCLGVFRRYQIAVVLVIGQIFLMLLLLLGGYGRLVYRGREPTGEDIIVILTGLGLGLCLGLDIAWLNKLRESVKTGHVHRPPLRFTIGHLTGCLIVMGCIFGIARARYVDRYHDRGHGIAREKAPILLPADASEITYTVQSNTYLDCDFATSEEAFTSWFESELPEKRPECRGVPLQPITLPVDVRRYFHEGRGNRKFNIVDGLHATWRVGGIQYEVTFDRQDQRGFYRNRIARD